MAAESPKGKEYWMDEIAFLEARLNGRQGDIDSDDRKACEEALKVAKVNLSTRQWEWSSLLNPIIASIASKLLHSWYLL